MSFLILSFNKAKISKTIDILRCLVNRLSLTSIVNKKIMPIKRNY